MRVSDLAVRLALFIHDTEVRPHSYQFRIQMEYSKTETLLNIIKIYDLVPLGAPVLQWLPKISIAFIPFKITFLGTKCNLHQSSILRSSSFLWLSYNIGIPDGLFELCLFYLLVFYFGLCRAL